MNRLDELASDLKNSLWMFDPKRIKALNNYEPKKNKN